MESVFSETLSFTVTIKPDIERTIHTFSAGGGSTDTVQIFVDAFYEDVTYKADFEDEKGVTLGMIVVALKFPEWLPNADYYNTYQLFTTKMAEMGLELEDSSMRQVQTCLDLDRPSLIREAISRLDSISDAARDLLDKKAESA